MAAKSGRKRGLTRGRHFISHYRLRRNRLKKIIFLVEDNPDDEALTLIAFKNSHVANDIVVAHDGVEALDYLFGTGAYAGRDTSIAPTLVLLDLNLPKLDGLDVLRRIREDNRTLRIPV